jgi:hypothetical protein
MRTKRLITGLDNSQKIRVIVNGVGFYTTVRGAFDMCFHSQRIAVTSALTSLGFDQSLPADRRPSGFGTRMSVYDHDSKRVEIDVQVDLC